MSTLDTWHDWASTDAAEIVFAATLGARMIFILTF
jgi:hypothetical protein